jgi:hypothetical protein
MSDYIVGLLFADVRPGIDTSECQKGRGGIIGDQWPA